MVCDYDYYEGQTWDDILEYIFDLEDALEYCHSKDKALLEYYDENSKQ